MSPVLTLITPILLRSIFRVHRTIVRNFIHTNVSGWVHIVVHRLLWPILRTHTLLFVQRIYTHLAWFNISPRLRRKLAWLLIVRWGSAHFLLGLLEGIYVGHIFLWHFLHICCILLLFILLWVLIPTWNLTWILISIIQMHILPINFRMLLLKLHVGSITILILFIFPSTDRLHFYPLLLAFLFI